MVPYFCGYEDVGAGDGRFGGEELGESGADFVFVLVEPRAVEVAVAGGEGGEDGGVSFTFGSFVCEGSKA